MTSLFRMFLFIEMYIFILLINYAILCSGQLAGEDYDDVVTRDIADVLGEKETEDRNQKVFQADCVDETKVKPELVVKLKSGDWKIEDDALKNWALCVLVKLGLMTRQGVFVMNEAMYRLPEMSDKTKAEKLVDECLNIKATTPRDAAWNYVRCHHEKDSEGNFPTLSIFQR